MLLGLGGLELCRAIRKKDTQVPILMLTALNSPENIVTGLDSGANDHLVKLFNLMYGMPWYRLTSALSLHIIRLDKYIIHIHTKEVQGTDVQVLYSGLEVRWFHSANLRHNMC